MCSANILKVRLSTLVIALAFGAYLPLVGCGKDDTKTSNGDGGTLDASLIGDGAISTDASLLPDGRVPADAGWHSGDCIITYCEGKLYQCGDCEDNDGDGLIDSQDPGCLGPCDHNEAGYNTMIPGANNAPCKADCYFDKDSGAGNDDCYWDMRCDPLQPQAVQTCNYAVECNSCPCEDWYDVQSEQCLGYCLPLVPNGCDCFGCCALTPGEGDEWDWRFIGSPGCGPDSISSCDPCTPVPSCLNDCGPCEICIGRPELPPECFEEGQTCPPGQQQCGQPGDDPCPAGTYCITGCCVPVVN